MQILVIPNLMETTMADLFTQEQLTQLAEMLKPMITEVATKEAAAHVTKRNESFEKKLESKFQSPSPAAKDEEQDQEKLTLTQRQNKLEEDNKKLRQDLKAKEQASYHKDMRARAEAKLLKDGVPQNQLKGVIAQLLHEDKLLGVDQEGTPYFKNFEGENVELEEGLSGWMKNEGKVYLPTPAAKGSPQRTSIRSRQGNPPTGFATEAELDDGIDQLVRSLR